VLTVAQPYTVAASGPDEYQYFAVPTGFTEDRFVRAVEVRPGNRRVVHHLVVFVQPPPTKSVQAPTKSVPASHALTEVDSQPGASAADFTQYRDGLVDRTKQDSPVYDDGCSLPNGGGGFRRDVSKAEPVPGILAEYLPGNRGEIMEPESAKRIPAGSVLLFQVHYAKTTGEVQKDQSSIGLIFAKSQPRKVVDTKLVFNAYFSIPPGSPSHQTTACWKLTDDAHIVSLTPHMHFRGKAMEIKAIFPDGRSEVLLNVPNYKFGWQTIYYLKRPLAAPKGTRIAVTSLFDNSTNNKYNPDPTRAVRWGEPTYDEMLAAFIGYSVKLNK
jgi:Copper type II ascorbate-dependent monooxygenase, C-terminal domain